MCLINQPAISRDKDTLKQALSLGEIGKALNTIKNEKDRDTAEKSVLKTLRSSNPPNIKATVVKTVAIGGRVALATLAGTGMILMGIAGGAVSLPVLVVAAAITAVPITLGIGIFSVFAGKHGKKRGETDLLYPGAPLVQIP